MTCPEDRRDLSRLETIPSCRGFAGTLVYLVTVVVLCAVLVRVVTGRRCRCRA